MNPTIEIELQQYVQARLSPFEPEAPLIVVPVYNAVEDVVECVNSLLGTLSIETPLFVIDDASPDVRISQALESLQHHANFIHVRLPENAGFVRTINRAFQWGRPHDVVIVNSDVVVPAGWLARLRAAAYAQSNIASATPLTNHGTLVSVPYRNRPISELVNGLTLGQADARVAAAALQLRPVIPTAVGHMIYFKRAALETAGFFDEIFSPGYGEEVDLSQRMIAAGFCHVAADDLLVLHKGSRSFGQQSEVRQRLQAEHEQIIQERYFWYAKWIEEATQDRQSPLALALERANGALLGYHIAIDATCLNGTTTGTQVGTLELIRALANSPRRFGQLTIIVGEGVPPSALRGLETLVDEIVTVSQLRHTDIPRFDLVHRPFQVVSTNDLKMLRTIARRFVVSHLDCISFSNPSYMLGVDDWLAYRSLTRQVFASADGMTFISSHAALDAAHKGLILPPERQCVIYFGVDHQLHANTEDVQPPKDSARFEAQPFLLVMGTNFKHKNRVYAIRVLQALVKQYQWPGQLVLAGPHVAAGGSETDEDRERAHCPELQDRIHDLGAVSEAEKVWLLQHAALVLYPSLYEGFGLIPFEAAAGHTPTLTFQATALGEVLGDQVTYLKDHDLAGSTDIVWRFLQDENLARQQVASIQAQAARFTWDSVADTSWGFYEQILRMPSRWPGAAVSDTPSIESHTFPPPQSAEGPVRGWLRRIRAGLHVLRTGGLPALQKEIRQYVQWRRAQF